VNLRSHAVQHFNGIFDGIQILLGSAHKQLAQTVVEEDALARIGQIVGVTGELLIDSREARESVGIGTGLANKMQACLQVARE